MRLVRYGGFLAVAFFLLGSCSIQRTYKPDYSVTYGKITGSEDAAIAAKVAPYREQMRVLMSEKVATAQGDFTLARPEGTLNNLMGDVMRRWSGHVAKQRVHIGLMNYGGIRTQWRAGDLTVGDVYEMMPFDNRLVLVQITGTAVKAMADELAQRGGEATSGIRFAITPAGNATDILVSGYPLSPDSLYWVACSDYIADNPDYLKSLLNPVARRDFDLMLRDVIVGYLKSKERIEPVLDGRVRKL